RRAGRSEPRATGVRELPGAYIRKMMPRIESGLVLDIRPGKQVLKTNFNVGTPAWLLTSSSGGSKSHHHLHLGCRIKARSIARASCYTCVAGKFQEGRRMRKAPGPSPRIPLGKGVAALEPCTRQGSYSDRYRLRFCTTV